MPPKGSLKSVQAALATVGTQTRGQRVPTLPCHVCLKQNRYAQCRFPQAGYSLPARSIPKGSLKSVQAAFDDCRNTDAWAASAHPT